MCKAPVKSSPPTNQHPVFYRPDALPVAQPTVPNHLRENITFHGLATHTHRQTVWQTNAQLSAAEKPHRIPDILLHISMHRDADFSNFLSLSNASIVLKYRVVFQTSRYFMSSNFSTAWQGYHSGLSTLHSYRTVTGVSK